MQVMMYALPAYLADEGSMGEVALSFAAAGLITPWMAGIGMGASSLIVVLNALRVRAKGRGTRGEGLGMKQGLGAKEFSAHTVNQAIRS